MTASSLPSIAELLLPHMILTMARYPTTQASRNLCAPCFGCSDFMKAGKVDYNQPTGSSYTQRWLHTLVPSTLGMATSACPASRVELDQAGGKQPA